MNFLRERHPELTNAHDDLWVAAAHNDLDGAMRACEVLGADVNRLDYKRRSPLKLAMCSHARGCSESGVDVIRLLLRARANLVEQDSDVRSVRHTDRQAGRQTDICELDVCLTIFMSLLSFEISLF